MLAGAPCFAAMLPPAQASAASSISSKAERRGAAVGMQDDDGDARRGEQQGEPLEAAHPLAGEAHRQADGKEHLDLNHQRGKARRDVAVHGDIEQAELADPDQQAVERKVAQRHRRAGKEEQGGEQHEAEAQGGEQQRRQVPEGELDDHEVGAPDGDHGEREQEVAQGKGGGHAGIVAWGIQSTPSPLVRFCYSIAP
jgi:hypothetical protein